MISQRGLLAALLCAAWILPGLFAHDPWKPDEALAFGVVYELLQGGSWVVPSLAGEPFVEKPPLYYLTAAAVAKLFSWALPLHDAARLATGLWMAVVFGFIAVTGRALYGVRYGAISALLLLGCFGFVIRAHQLIPDVALLAGFAMAYYGFAAALQRPLWGGLWIGTGIGVGFMANGLLAPMVLGVAALLLPALCRDWRTPGYVATLGVAVLAAAPWLAIWPWLLYQRSPVLFEAWLWTESIGHYFGPARGVRAGVLYYLKILPWYAFPVWLLALWTVWGARARGLMRPAIVLPLTGFALTFAALSGSSEARELYALPLLLPLALLAAAAPETLRRGAASAWYWFSAMAFTFFVVVFWFYWSGLELGVPARLHEHLHRIRPGYTPGFRWLPFLLGIVYSLFWFAVLASFRKTPMRPVVVWGAGITVIWALLTTLFIGWADNAKSYRAPFVAMHEALPNKYDCVASRELGESQRAMLHYFAGIVTHREEIPDRRRACQLLLVQGHPKVENTPRGGWKKIWEGGRPGDKDERYRLYRRPGPPPKQ
jgi:4-amino-4-deoxy-L-arabinose transferase-like glycosyltransferase